MARRRHGVTADSMYPIFESFRNLDNIKIRLEMGDLGAVSVNGEGPCAKYISKQTLSGVDFVSADLRIGTPRQRVLTLEPNEFHKRKLTIIKFGVIQV